MAEALAQRGWTRYRLVQASGLSATVVYRVANKGAPVRRIDGRTLDRVCDALDVQPGDLLVHVPSRKRKGRAP